MIKSIVDLVYLKRGIGLRITESAMKHLQFNFYKLGSVCFVVLR